jgi:hypothetical protein
MSAPVASGWSGRRVGLAPTGKAPPCHGARGKPTLACGLSHGACARIRLSDLPGRDNEDKRLKMEIQSNTLDTLCPVEPAENTLIWMDTQGYEGYVLAGARGWLDAGTPLVMEFDPYLMKRVNSFGLMKAALAN